nr:hypothetical protein [Tanacetum cinerariifolium]
MEIESIGLSRELMVGALFSNILVGSGHGSKQPNAIQKVDDDIDGLISNFENKKTSVLDKLLKTTTEAKALQEKESKQDSIDKHTVLAYRKYMGCYGPNAPRDSWLNIDDTILHDDDFIGLEIPIDDLSNIKMIV